MKNEPLKVLLAEDDEDDFIIFKLALQNASANIRLRHAIDGEMLFIMLRQEIPDIIFLDINMPCRNGVACITEIRKNSAFNDIPIIMYTSFKGAKHIDDCYSNGANFYLFKGNSISEIGEKLKMIFSIDWKNFSYYPPKSEFVLNAV